MSDKLDGDGIGGAVLEILTGNAFILLVSHTRKDNVGDYGKTEKIILSPKNWFHGNNKKLNVDGYYLDNFIKIDNSTLNFTY